MFRINRRTDYAVRAMLCLARQPYPARLATQAIQDEMLIPRPFLHRIIAGLSKAGLIQTYPGPGGGVQLAREAKAISLLQIWEAIEGPLLISDCLGDCGVCPLDVRCPVRNHWGQLQGMIIHELKNIPLDQLVAESNQLSERVSARNM